MTFICAAWFFAGTTLGLLAALSGIVLLPLLELRRQDREWSATLFHAWNLAKTDLDRAQLELQARHKEQDRPPLPGHPE